MKMIKTMVAALAISCSVFAGLNDKVHDPYMEGFVSAYVPFYGGMDGIVLGLEGRGVLPLGDQVEVGAGMEVFIFPDCLPHRPLLQPNIFVRGALDENLSLELSLFKCISTYHWEVGNAGIKPTLIYTLDSGQFIRLGIEGALSLKEWNGASICTGIKF